MSNPKKIEKLDSTFKYKISQIPGGETVKSCFSCGVCTAACPVNKVNKDFNPRQIIRMILMGYKEEVLSSDLIWYCILCERCFANCPQKVNFAHIIRALREMSLKERYIERGLPDTIPEIDLLTYKLRKELLDNLLKNKKTIDKLDLLKAFKEAVNNLEK